MGNKPGREGIGPKNSVRAFADGKPPTGILNIADDQDYAS